VPASRRVVRYRYSLSEEGAEAGQGVMDSSTEPTWRDASLRTTALYCLPANRTLMSGKAYVMHVQVWLSPDTYVTVTSPAVRVDHTPPSRRRGSAVTEPLTSSCTGRDVDFKTQASSVTSCWTGVFSDPQSNIVRYDFWVGSVPYGGFILLFDKQLVFPD
jgi:hypothetical protein